MSNVNNRTMNEQNKKGITKLEKKISIKGKIKLLTGLHIGGSNAAVQIGGIDSPVIRNPINQQPYIPGSSLKGKIRCLLEQSEGIFGPEVGSNVQYGPSVDPTNPISLLFGFTQRKKEKGEQEEQKEQNEQNEQKENTYPSLLIFRDSYLLNAESLWKNKNTDLPYTEAKTEVVIDRIKGTATPRQIERVPAGVEFSFEIIFNVWKSEEHFERYVDEETGLSILSKGMKLLECDYLGGKGSRGSGQVKFKVEEVNVIDLASGQTSLHQEYLSEFFKGFTY